MCFDIKTNDDVRLSLDNLFKELESKRVDTIKFQLMREEEANFISCWN